MPGCAKLSCIWFSGLGFRFSCCSAEEKAVRLGIAARDQFRVPHLEAKQQFSDTLQPVVRNALALQPLHPLYRVLHPNHQSLKSHSRTRSKLYFPKQATEVLGILLGGSWVAINGVIIGVTILITHVRGLLTPLMTTHEPPSMLANIPSSCLAELIVSAPRNGGASRRHQVRPLVQGIRAFRV